MFGLIGHGDLEHVDTIIANLSRNDETSRAALVVVSNLNKSFGYIFNLIKASSCKFDSLSIEVLISKVEADCSFALISATNLSLSCTIDSVGRSLNLRINGHLLRGVGCHLVRGLICVIDGNNIVTVFS